MRLSSLVYFYRLRLRTRWVQELFAFVGIAVGVALLFAAQVASTSLSASVKQMVDGTFGNADLQVMARGPEGIDSAAVERVRRVDGVRVVAPLLEVRATVVGPNGREGLTVLGADQALTRLGGSILARYRDVPLPATRALALPRPIVERLGAPVGGQVKLEVGGETVAAKLGVALTADDVGPLAESPFAVAALPYIQDLSGQHGRVTRVLVESETGRSASVKRALTVLAADRLNVRSADFDVKLFRAAAAPTNRSTTLFAVISALVGFLFAFNAMLLTLADRKRLIKALRLDGYRPLAIAQVALFDALVLGIAASLGGLALGDQLSRLLFDDAPGYLSFAFPVGDQRIVEWRSVAVAVVGGVAASLLAALAPLLGSARSSPGREGSAPLQSSVWRLSFVGGLVCLAISTTIVLLAPAAAIVGVATLICACMLMLPGLVGLTLRVAQRLLRDVRSAIPLISIGEVRSMSARSIAVAATGALAVFGSVAIQASSEDLQRGLDRASVDLNGIADVWATPSGESNAFATVPFRRSAATELEQLPASRAVRTYHSGFLDIGERRVWTIAPPRDAPSPIPSSQLLAGNLGEATRRLRGGGWIVVSEGVAGQLGLHIGDRVELPTPRPISVRVAALSTNMGWAPGAIVIGAGDYRHGWGPTAPTAYHVMLARGVTPDDGRQDVQNALGGGSAVTVETAQQRQDRHFALSRQGLSRLNQLALLVQLAAVLAMGAALGGMVWQRRARLASLKLDGFDDFTVWRALLLESLLLLGAGCLTGGVFGLYGQQLLDRALVNVTGFPIVSSVGLGLAAVSFLSVTTVAVAIAALPGYLAARVPTTVALQD